MNKQKQALSNHLDTLAEDARALMSATADVAGEKISNARKRLSDALESGKEFYGQVRDKAAEGVKTTDRVVRENPYRTIGIAFGVGALAGYLIAHRCASKCD